LEQLRAARRGFELGQGTRTDIDDAQARYDLAMAQGVQARQNRVLAERQLALQLGLGQGEPIKLAILPLQVTQAPAAGGSLDHWLSLAQQHNPELQLARAKLALAQLEVERAQAGHYPTVDAIGQRSLSKSENTQFPRSSYFSTQIGVQINIPLYAGGATESAIRQALANRERERFAVEQVSNDLAIKVQREHNTLTEGEKRLQAARQSLLSAEQLVISTGRGMMAGTRTIVDRLNAVQRRAEARRELALVLYQLHLARLKLAALAAPDGQEAVDEVNRLLVASP
jgi:outer membrane protein TolC